MVIIDTDILWLIFAFHNDARQIPNERFLESVRDSYPATTIYNLMELLGHMSFNLSAARLSEYESWLTRPYNLQILYPEARGQPSPDKFFSYELVERPFSKMSTVKMSYLDSLILDLAERTTDVEHFVTWNAKHFKNKSTLSVVTPAEYLEL